MISAVPYFYLALAITFEVIATSSLKNSDGLTRLWPSTVSAIGYVITFYFLALTLRTMPIGIAYAIWSGVGLVLTVIAGMIIWKETLDWARVTGIVLIIAGIILINGFSKTTVH